MNPPCKSARDAAIAIGRYCARKFIEPLDFSATSVRGVGNDLDVRWFAERIQKAIEDEAKIVEAVFLSRSRKVTFKSRFYRQKDRE